jgi:hypothetical protein
VCLVGLDWMVEIELIGLKMILMKEYDGFSSQVIDSDNLCGLSNGSFTYRIGVFCL